MGLWGSTVEVMTGGQRLQVLVDRNFDLLDGGDFGSAYRIEGRIGVGSKELRPEFPQGRYLKVLTLRAVT